MSNASHPLASAPTADAPPLTNRRILLRFATTASLVPFLAATGLAGCSPKLNWREARLPGGEVRMQFPDKPASMTREIHLRDRKIEMTMMGAEVDGLAFTVAIAQGGPEETAADIAAHLDDMRDQMLRNIAAPTGSPTEISTLTIPLVDPAGGRRGEREASFVNAFGAGKSEGMRLQGAFFTAGRLAAQAVVIGRPFDDQAAHHFFDSLRIVQS